MKTIFILLVFLVISVSAQWEWKGGTIPVFNTQGWALDAYDSLNAVIAIIPQVPTSDLDLFITTDGGTTWNGSGPRNKWIVDVSMISPMKIWFVTADPNEIWRTSDGGLNWELLLTADTLTSFFNYIKMFDDSTGIVMGDALRSKPALFLRTTDAGDTWFSVNENYFIDGISVDGWRTLSFPSSNTGYFYRSRLFKTTDGGSNWSEDTRIDKLFVLNFYDENYGMCFRMNCDSVGNFMLRTTDGGASWDSLFVFNDLSIFPTRGYGIDIEFLTDDPSKVWFTTLDTLYFSSDSGSTWHKDNLSESFHLARDLKIVDGKVCWFLCETVYRNLNADVLISAEENIPEIPAAFTLYQNYPNPFNPSTKIKYSITEPCFIKLTIYDIIGREIKVLQDGFLAAGVHSTEFNSENLPSGVYIYILKAGEYVQSRKMLLLK